jgi:hypothetical protein
VRRVDDPRAPVLQHLVKGSDEKIKAVADIVRKFEAFGFFKAYEAIKVCSRG